MARGPEVSPPGGPLGGESRHGYLDEMTATGESLDTASARGATSSGRSLIAPLPHLRRHSSLASGATKVPSKRKASEAPVAGVWASCSRAGRTGGFCVLRCPFRDQLAPFVADRSHSEGEALWRQKAVHRSHDAGCCANREHKRAVRSLRSGESRTKLIRRPAKLKWSSGGGGLLNRLVSV